MVLVAEFHGKVSVQEPNTRPLGSIQNDVRFFKALRCMNCISRALFVLSSYPSRSDVPVLDEEAWNFNTKTTAQCNEAKSQV